MKLYLILKDVLPCFKTKQMTFPREKTKQINRLWRENIRLFKIKTDLAKVVTLMIAWLS